MIFGRLDPGGKNDAQKRKKVKKCILFRTVLWIRIGFNADPDPAFYLNGDPDPGSHEKYT
jgi:hypothetical protein